MHANVFIIHDGRNHGMALNQSVVITILIILEQNCHFFGDHDARAVNALTDRDPLLIIEHTVD